VCNFESLDHPKDVNKLKPILSQSTFRQRAHSQGFSLPTATGFGLIILIVGQTMILRSFNDRVATLGQVASNEAVAAAEVGLTRYQAFLNRNRELAFLNACVPAVVTDTTTIIPPATNTNDVNTGSNDIGSVNNPGGVNNPSECGSNTWRNAETALAEKVCPNSSPSVRTQRLQMLAATDTAAWQDIDPNDPRKGQFRLISYTVTDQKGLLTVEGRIPKDGTSSTARDIAAARLQVTIPLTPSSSGQPSLYPGVWLQTLPTSSNNYFNSSANVGSSNPTDAPAIALDVRANVFINDCGVDLRAVRTNPNNAPSTYAVIQTDMPMPALPPVPRVSSTVGDSAANASPSPSVNYLQANFDGITSNEPTPTTSQQAYGLGTINANLTLPRSGDVGRVEEGASPVQVYRYVVDDINLSSRNRLTINSSPREVEVDNRVQTLPVRVELYVQGDLVTGSRIRHDCNSSSNIPCEPTNFRIYAYQYSTNPPESSEYPSFCLTGSRPLKAMIFAPGYRVGTSGSAKLEGTLWARSWATDCDANSDQIMLSQSGNWGNQRVTLPPKLGVIQQWQRQQVSQEGSP
jgi:hypothetical protein